MKFLKIGGGIVAVLLLAFVGAAAAQPTHQHIERSAHVKALPQDVSPLIVDYANWGKWSPWGDLDPNQKVTISTPSTGKGATYHWSGNNDVGEGEMKILEVEPQRKLVESLHFLRPFEATATITFTMGVDGEGTKVTWGYDTERNFMAKAMGLVMDMEGMLGADFDKGLGRMSKLAEADAAARIEKEKAIQAASEAAEAAQAALPAGGEAAPAPAAAAGASGTAAPGTIPGTLPQ